MIGFDSNTSNLQRGPDSRLLSIGYVATPLMLRCLRSMGVRRRNRDGCRIFDRARARERVSQFRIVSKYFVFIAYRLSSVDSELIASSAGDQCRCLFAFGLSCLCKVCNEFCGSSRRCPRNSDQSLESFRYSAVGRHHSETPTKNSSTSLRALPGIMQKKQRKCEPGVTSKEMQEGSACEEEVVF